MKITLDKAQAERILLTHFARTFDEVVEEVSIVATEEAETKFVSVQTTSLMLQNAWRESISATNDNTSYRPFKIVLIRLFLNLHLKLTGHRASLSEAKHFVESHEM